MKTTILALYSNVVVAYYVLLNLNRAGCEAGEMGLVMLQDPLANSPTSEATEVAGRVGSEFDSVTNNLTGLLENVSTIFAPRRLRIVIAGSMLNVIRNALDTVLHADVDPLPNSLKTVLRELNVEEQDAALLAGGVQEGHVLVAVQVTDDLRKDAVTIIDAFLPSHLAYCQGEWHSDYELIYQWGAADETHPARRSFTNQLRRK